LVEQPVLHSERLILRPFRLEDAGIVQKLAGERDIAATTLAIPHPYEDGVAERWIDAQREAFIKDESVTYAVTLRETGELVGAIGLAIAREYDRAEMGYWIGKPYWGRGYCTEAARALLGYAFGALGLNRVHACHFTRNPASGRVMQKAGMAYEGCQRQHVKRWEQYEDLARYGILRADYEALPGRGAI